jgi:hypothetical protein
MAPIAPTPRPFEEGRSDGVASPRRPRRRPRRMLAAVGLAAVLAGSLAACGADTGGDDVASLATGEQAGGTSTTEVTPLTEEEIAEAQEAFQECMKEHGVDIQMAPVEGDGTGGGGMVTRTEAGAAGDAPEDMPSMEEMEAANEECQPLMEKVIQNAPKPDPEEMARMKEQALQFAQCMRDNGVDMPDPEFSEDGGGITQSLGGPGETEDPDMETAMQTCREFMRGPNGEEPPEPGQGPIMRTGPAGGGE